MIKNDFSFYCEIPQGTTLEEVISNLISFEKEMEKINVKMEIPLKAQLAFISRNYEKESK